jgi:hypothetical protein
MFAGPDIKTTVLKIFICFLTVYLFTKVVLYEHRTDRTQTNATVTFMPLQALMGFCNIPNLKNCTNVRVYLSLFSVPKFTTFLLFRRPIEWLSRFFCKAALALHRVSGVRPLLFKIAITIA